MAPSSLVARDNCYNSYYSSYGDCYYSSWDNWGRWVALVCIIVGLILIAILFSCITARRRRQQGLQPLYGTGWTTNYWNKNQPYYNNGPYNGGVPAPPYSPPVQHQQYTGNTFNGDEGYYGQQSGIEMQPPKNIYNPQRGGEQVYDAPQGPPPHKGGYEYGDGIIR